MARARRVGHSAGQEADAQHHDQIDGGEEEFTDSRPEGPLGNQEDESCAERPAHQDAQAHL